MKITCSFAPEEEAQEARTGEVLERRADGFFLASNTLYPPGTTLALRVEIPGKRLPERLRGEVRWARTSARAGMQVTLLDPAEPVATMERPASAPDVPVKPRGPLRSG